MLSSPAAPCPQLAARLGPCPVATLVTTTTARGFSTTCHPRVPVVRVPLLWGLATECSSPHPQGTAAPHQASSLGLDSCFNHTRLAGLPPGAPLPARVFHPTCPSSLPRACPSGAGHGATHRITGHSRRGFCLSNTLLSSEPSLHPPPRPRVLAEGCSNWPLSPDQQTLLHRGRGPAPQESECWARLWSGLPPRSSSPGQ